MSFGESNLHERVEQLERHNEILQADVDLYRGRWMARGAAIAEQKERIGELESLVLDMRWHIYNDCGHSGLTLDCDRCEHRTDAGCKYALEFDERMTALGLMEGDAE